MSDHHEEFFGRVASRAVPLHVALSDARDGLPLEERGRRKKKKQLHPN